MVRKEIRDFVRILADERKEAPEGLFYNADLNILINIAQRNAQMYLQRIFPEYFRYPKTFNTTATVRTISITGVAPGLALTDFMLVEEIIRDASGERATPLVHIDPDQLVENNVEPDDTGLPRFWYYDDRSTIALAPIPDAAYAFKLYYSRRIHALNDDSTDDPVTAKYATPELPDELHPIIAYEVLKLWHMRDEEEKADIEVAIQEQLKLVLPILGQKQGLTLMSRASMREKIATE